jgi:hypothetical protein
MVTRELVKPWSLGAYPIPRNQLAPRTLGFSLAHSQRFLMGSELIDLPIGDTLMLEPVGHTPRVLMQGRKKTDS